jgi:hypothetical protein
MQITHSERKKRTGDELLMKTKKKFLTILLTVCLVMAMIPMTVLAADEVQEIQIPGMAVLLLHLQVEPVRRKIHIRFPVGQNWHILQVR